MREAQAKILSDLERTWRQWRALIAELQDELSAQNTAGGGDDLFAPVGGTAQRRKANIPVVARKQIEGVLELRRQQMQAEAEKKARTSGTAMPDPDKIRADLIAQVERELQGGAHPQGLALVWWNDTLMEFDHRRIMNATSTSDYLAAGGGPSGPSKRTAIIAMAGLAVVLVVAVVIIFNLAFGSEPVKQTAQGSGEAAVGQELVPLWDTRQVSAGGVVLPASVRGSAYPLTLCVSGGKLPDEVSGALVVTGTTSVRTYQVVPVANDTTYDMLLTACDSGKALVAGIIQRADTSRPLDQTTIADVMVDGPDMDPAAIPSDRMRVTLTVTLPEANGTLILADGSRWSPTDRTAREGTTALLYLVPLSVTPQDAGWEVQEEGNPLPAVTSIHIPSPLPRLAFLQDHLKVGQASIEPLTINDQPGQAVRIALQNVGKIPLTLLPNDVRLLSNGSTSITPVGLVLPTIAPDESADLLVPLPVGVTDSLEVRVGIWRASIGKE